MDRSLKTSRLKGLGITTLLKIKLE